MKKSVLFIHGGGEAGYEADSKLAASLQRALGESYYVYYPRLQTNTTLPDFGWVKQIEKQISDTKGKAFLVAHSLGASMLLKCLSENEIKKSLAGIFLLSTPFWSGDESWVLGLKLKEDFAELLPKNVPIFFFHCQDDEEIPFGHLTNYKQKIPGAAFREIKSGGHQFNNNLSTVANYIKSIL